MLQLILIVLLAQDIHANTGYRNYYRPLQRYHGMQKGYSYKKPMNTYKKPVTAVAPYCRCIRETTMLNMVVLDQGGTPLGNAAVWIGFEGQVKESKTDNKGFLKVEVTGCEIGITVWHDGKQAESRIVNLEKTKTSYKNVVIQVGKACNFLIYFFTPTLNFFNTTLISYLADINGGDQSTSGTAVVGADASPLCINVQDGGSLKVVVIAQSADLFSVLCLDEVEEGGQASMGLPLPITWFLSNPSSPDTFSLVGGVNLYKEKICEIKFKKECKKLYETVVKTEFKQKCTTFYSRECHGEGYQRKCIQVPRQECEQLPFKVEKMIPIESCEDVPIEVCEDNDLRLIARADNSFLYVEDGEVKETSVTISRFNFWVPDMLERSNYLASIKLRTTGAVPRSYQGNVYIIDERGVTKIIKIPSEPYSGNLVWVLGCIIDGNLKNWREINKFTTINVRAIDDEEFEKLCEKGILPTPAPVSF